MVCDFTEAIIRHIGHRYAVLCAVSDINVVEPDPKTCHDAASLARLDHSCCRRCPAGHDCLAVRGESDECLLIRVGCDYGFGMDPLEDFFFDSEVRPGDVGDEDFGHP